MHIANKDINGVDAQIHADKYGTWSILDPEGIMLSRSDTSLDAAIASARIVIKKRQVKVSVLFKTMDGKEGIADSFHARNSRKILTTIDGKREQIDSHTRVLRADTPGLKISRVCSLRKAARDANREADLIEQKYRLDLLKAMNEAIEAAQNENTRVQS